MPAAVHSASHSRACARSVICGHSGPNHEALLRLAGAVLAEAHDEWPTGDRRYLAEGTTALLTTPPGATTAELVAAQPPATLPAHPRTDKLINQQSLTRRRSPPLRGT